MNQICTDCAISNVRQWWGLSTKSCLLESFCFHVYGTVCVYYADWDRTQIVRLWNIVMFMSLGSHCFVFGLLVKVAPSCEKVKTKSLINTWHTWNQQTHMNDDTLVQQALLLRCHDEVVRFVFVVNNVLQINACTKDKLMIWSVRKSHSLRKMKDTVLLRSAWVSEDLTRIQLKRNRSHGRYTKLMYFWMEEVHNPIRDKHLHLSDKSWLEQDNWKMSVHTSR